jgi:hypothetical protein
MGAAARAGTAAHDSSAQHIAIAADPARKYRCIVEYLQKVTGVDAGQFIARHSRL